MMLGQETELLYQISLVIGSSSHLDTMLQRTAVSLLRHLNATSCAVVRLAGECGESITPVCLLPRHAEANPAWRELHVFLSQGDVTDEPVVVRDVARSGHDGHLYVYRLIDFGFLAFCKHGAPLPRSLLEAFIPLAAKLAFAARACLADESLRLAASVFENSQEGILIADARNRIIDVNEAFSRITGYSRLDVLGRNPAFLGADLHPPQFFEDLWRDLLTHDHWRGEFWNRRKDGEVLAEIVSIAVIRNDAGGVQNFVAIFSDISHIKEHEAELHRISHFDPLTGLPNRRLLDDRLRQAMSHADRHAGSVSICLLDLDGFKEINDRFGHKMGDNLLCIVAGRLKSCLRDGDTVARLGGDEFLLVFPSLSHDGEYEVIMRRILEAMALPAWLDGNRLQVSASIGVTFFPADDVDADTLIRHADHAMYQAKQSGKNRYQLFDAEQDKKLKSRRAMLARASLGLEEDEYRLHYQPKIDLHTGDVVGAEALIRWYHPENGVHLPNDFLPPLSGHLFEIDLGNWVVAESARQYARWRANGLRLPISINVSAAYLQHESFIPALQTALADLPADAARDFEIEILETTAISRMDDVSRTLAECAALGVSIALDDFGTGYSSLSYFRKLPINTLKIDCEFVRNMLDNAADHSIVEAIVRLALAFNRDVVAEGVESIEHAACLYRLECRVAQGFAFAAPLPAGDLPDWIETWKKSSLWRQLHFHTEFFAGPPSHQFPLYSTPDFGL